MLTFLLLASTNGAPLPADAVARLSDLPLPLLPHDPETATAWLSEGDHVGVAAWQTRPGVHGGSHWHVGAHGVTLADGSLWPLAGAWGAPTGWAFELTDLLARSRPADVLARLTGTGSVVRVHPDGSGVVASPPTGAGGVHVAHTEGLVAVSNRAAVAAAGAGLPVTVVPGPAGLLVHGTLLGSEGAVAGTELLGPGHALELRAGEGPKVVARPPAWHDDTPVDLGGLVGAAVDAIAAMVESAAANPSTGRFVELHAHPSARVLAAAVAATGTTDRFRFRAVGDERDHRAARALADALGVHLETDAGGVPTGLDGLDGWVRTRVGRAGGAVSARLLQRRVPADGQLVVASSGAVLRPRDPGAVHDLLTPPARARLDGTLQSWRDAAVAAGHPVAALPVLFELEHRLPRRAAAEATAAGAAVLLDPLHTTAVARLAVHAAREGVDVTDRLVARLAPTLDLDAPGGDPDPDDVRRRWRALAPLAETHVLGHGRDVLAPHLDLDGVAATLRAPLPPDTGTEVLLWGALTHAVAARTARRWPVPRRALHVSAEVVAPPRRPVLVTGITSGSVLELAELRLSLDDTAPDALLGVDVDVRVAELVSRLLLACEATPGALPPDLGERLAGEATAPFAEAARALLERRGGVLSDPRLGLTVPFWRAHVADPRVVLVAERPTDLAARTRSRVPPAVLLGWWVEVVSATLTAADDVRILDPGDLDERTGPEGAGWRASDVTTDDVLQLARQVDSLVREVEAEAVRPLLATVLRARSRAAAADATASAGPVGAPLHLVDDLWQQAVAAQAGVDAAGTDVAALSSRVDELTRELGALRRRRGWRAAWQVLRGQPADARVDDTGAGPGRDPGRLDDGG
ncbi:MAG: hypothetical protein ACLGIR_03180 [Actinomycetes bacterium]